MSTLSDCDDYDEINEAFISATTYLEANVGQIDQKALLNFYGLYKQATVGKCNTSKPGMFNLQQKSKWNAWNDLGEMAMQEAKQQYIDKLIDLCPEFHPLKKIPKSQHWVSVSSHKKLEEFEEISEDMKTIFDFLKESNYSKLKSLLNTDNINQLDPSGLGLIHWAADRGDKEVLGLLLQNKANPNLQDKDGQTPLHYAASCGNLECIHVLLHYNADKTILDNDNSSCYNVAFDKSVITALDE